MRTCELARKKEKRKASPFWLKPFGPKMRSPTPKLLVLVVVGALFTVAIGALLMTCSVGGAQMPVIAAFAVGGLVCVCLPLWCVMEKSEPYFLNGTRPGPEPERILRRFKQGLQAEDIADSRLGRAEDWGCAGCAICLEDFAPREPVRGLSCGHAFHDECLSRWLAHSSCPLCRQRFRLGAAQPEARAAEPDPEPEGAPRMHAGERIVSL